MDVLLSPSLSGDIAGVVSLGVDSLFPAVSLQNVSSPLSPSQGRSFAAVLAAVVVVAAAAAVAVVVVAAFDLQHDSFGLPAGNDSSITSLSQLRFVAKIGMQQQSQEDQDLQRGCSPHPTARWLTGGRHQHLSL